MFNFFFKPNIKFHNTVWGVRSFCGVPGPKKSRNIGQKYKQTIFFK